MIPAFRIRQAGIGLKVVLTFFDLFFLLGLAGSIWIARLKIGGGPASIAQYYRGDPEGFRYPMSLLELLETSHPHAFSMGLVYLVLACVFLLTEISQKIRVVAVGLWGVLLLAKLLLPLAVRFGPSWGVFLVMPISGTFGLLTLWIVAQPLWEMWVPRR